MKIKVSMKISILRMHPEKMFGRSFCGIGGETLLEAVKGCEKQCEVLEPVPYE